MIDLPLKVKATGHGCVCASVAMVCAYWRVQKPNLNWKIPQDINDLKWQEVYKKGLRYVKASGMPFSMIPRYLRTLSMPLNVRLEYLSKSHQLENLLNAMTPPIVFYNQDFYLKGEKGIGHAVVITDKTDENFITIDPSFYPKCIYQIPKKEFEEAWKLEQNATIIISPKSNTFNRVKIPSRTIDMYASAGVV